MFELTADLWIFYYSYVKSTILVKIKCRFDSFTVWDNIQLTNYNFSWWDVSSFLPYTDETSVVDNSMLLKNSGGVTMSSMKSVLVSITQNARGIYKLIIENQLAANKTSNYQGKFLRNNGNRLETNNCFLIIL